MSASCPGFPSATVTTLTALHWLVLISALSLLPVNVSADAASALWAVAAGAVAVALTIASPALLAVLPGGQSAGNWPPARFPEFLLGVAVACLVRRGAWRGPGLVPSVAVAVAVAGFAAADRWPSSPLALAGFTLVGFTALIAALARADVAGVRTVLSSGPLVALGERSFAFYLVHLLVIDAVGALWPAGAERTWVGGLAMTALALDVALVAAWVLHAGVEKPCRRGLLALPSWVLPPDRSVTVRAVGCSERPPMRSPWCWPSSYCHDDHAEHPAGLRGRDPLHRRRAGRTDLVTNPNYRETGARKSPSYMREGLDSADY